MSLLFQDLICGNNNPVDDVLIFESSDHVRFQNEIAVSGYNKGCYRNIEFKKNIEGGIGYTITIYNMDSLHPFWNTNIQMSPKRMKIVHTSDNLVELRGYGCDALGNTFADYGVVFMHNGIEIERVQLNMYDRHISIVYLK